MELNIAKKIKAHSMPTYRADAGGIHFTAGPVRNISNRRVPIEEEAAMGEIESRVGEHMNKLTHTENNVWT